MNDLSDKTLKAYRDWREAEAAYARILGAFGTQEEPPGGVDKDSALRLAKARDRADRGRDKFFKRVLK
jgi:hypothetical protein